MCIREYWPYRDELSTQNGLAYRGTRVIIPAVMRSEMTARAHPSHLGIQYTTGTAREIMYWPRMTVDLTEAVQKCPTCQEAQPAQQKEPMMSHPIPTYPWQAVASDCFVVGGQHYVILVDLYSDYIDIAPLTDLSTECLVQQLKPIFATHEIPAVLITDNGSNYSSQEFRDFNNSFEICHVTSSPHHHKSNGKAESAVKIMKGIVAKAQKEGKHMWKAILEWRNTPTPGMSSSPVQRLLSRRTRSMLPCSSIMFKPAIQTSVTSQIIQRKKQAKFYYDRKTKPLPKIVIGQPVQIKAHSQHPHSVWKPGTVVSATPSLRSYNIQVDGIEYRRNRVNVKDSLPAQSNLVTQKEPASLPVTSPPAPKPNTTRSGRVIKPPVK